MTLLPQDVAEIRKRLGKLSWNNSAVFIYFGIGTGGLLSKVAIAKGIAPMIAWPVGIGSGVGLGAYAAFLWSKPFYRKLMLYRIIVERDSFRVIGQVRGDMQEIRFTMADVKCITAWGRKRSAFFAYQPLVRALDSRGLTITEKSGASATFDLALSVFAPRDLTAFFDHLRERGIETPATSDRNENA